MTEKQLQKRIHMALAKIDAEIHTNAAGGSKYARGLASEGYAAGYREALFSHGFELQAS